MLIESVYEPDYRRDDPQERNRSWMHSRRISNPWTGNSTGRGGIGSRRRLCVIKEARRIVRSEGNVWRESGHFKILG